MPAIDTELAIVREHPLYVRIKEMITGHLTINGYDRVPVTVTRYAKDPTLSLDAAAELHTYIKAVRASFPVSNEKFVTFLNDQEEIYGESIVVRRGIGRYNVVLSYLIQLLCEFPDDFESVADAVTFLPVPSEEIERRHGEPTGFIERTRVILCSTDEFAMQILEVFPQIVPIRAA